MEYNLFTCEFDGIGTNIVATIKNDGKPVIKFNCQTKHMDIALQSIEEVLGNISFKEAIKLSGFEPEEI